MSDDLEHMSSEGRYLVVINYFDSCSEEAATERTPSSPLPPTKKLVSKAKKQSKKKGRFWGETIKWLMMAAIFEAAESNYGRRAATDRSQAPPPRPERGGAGHREGGARPTLNLVDSNGSSARYENLAGILCRTGKAAGRGYRRWEESHRTDGASSKVKCLVVNIAIFCRLEG